MTSVSIGNGPADDSQSKDEQEQSQAHEIEHLAVAEEVVAGARIYAYQNANDHNDGPGQKCGQAGMPADHGEKFTGRLSRRDPPWEDWRDNGSQGHGEKLTGYPALNFGPGFFPYQIIPGQQT